MRGGTGVGEADEGGQNVQRFWLIKITTTDVRYNMINITDSAICYIWKFLREQILKVLITRRQDFNF